MCQSQRKFIIIGAGVLDGDTDVFGDWLARISTGDCRVGFSIRSDCGLFDCASGSPIYRRAANSTAAKMINFPILVVFIYVLL
jgi:hypothetical protein